MRMLEIASMLLVGLCAASCLDLPTVDSGTCGNKIVDANEDCDGDATAPECTTCRAVGSAGACRFDCGPGSKCPDGYVCGSDAICRAHSGAFIEMGTAVPFSPTHLLVDDFDSDGRSDVLAYRVFGSEARALFFEPDGALASSVSMASDTMVPATGKLATKDAPSTFTIATHVGLGVMRGQTDRSFSPTPYSSLRLPWPEGHVLAFDARPPPPPPPPDAMPDAMDPYGARWLGDEAVIFYGDAAYVTEDVDLQPDKPDKATFRLPRSEPPVGPIPVGDIDTIDSPCQEMVLTYGDDKVYIVTPCIPAGGEAYRWNRQVGPGGAPVKTYPPVTLFDVTNTPVTTAKIAAVFLTQLNVEDEHLDLLINTWDDVSKESRFFAALGDGTGHFVGAIEQPMPMSPILVPNGAVEIPDLNVIKGDEKLLAVGDLNEDGRVDFVFPTAILVSGKDDSYDFAGIPRRGAWTDAAIADFNGDGLLDVICSTEDDVGIDFFTNAGDGALNPLVISTESGVTNFVVGDFDGDLTKDVAFRLRPLGGGKPMDGPAMPDMEPDSLGVIFGRFGQPPEPPRNLGQLSRIDSIVTGKTLVPEKPADAISDLGVVSNTLMGPAARTVAIFQGRSDRVLQSPFALNVPGDDPFSEKIIISTTIGQFDDGDHQSHLDIVALVGEKAFKVAPNTSNPGMDDTEIARYLVWLLPSTGTASLDTGTAKPLELPAAAFANVDLSTTQMATIDIDGDGQDEVALVMSYTDASNKSVLGVGLVKRDSDGKPSLVGPYPLSDELFNRTFGGPIAGGDKGGPSALYSAGRPSLCVADVDGDGKKDLVTFAADADSKPRVVILWNTGNTAKPFADTPGHVSIPTDPYITAFTCADIDGDPASEIVVLASRGAYSIDFVKREPGTPVPIAGVPPGNAVASGDFDGDGIADLVVATPADTRLYRGKPVIQ